MIVLGSSVAPVRRPPPRAPAASPSAPDVKPAKSVTPERPPLRAADTPPPAARKGFARVGPAAPPKPAPMAGRALPEDAWTTDLSDDPLINAILEQYGEALGRMPGERMRQAKAAKDIMLERGGNAMEDHINGIARRLGLPEIWSAARGASTTEGPGL